MSVSKILGKIIYFLFVSTCRPLEYLSPRAYMSLYSKVLRFVGVKIEGHPRYISRKVRFDEFSRISLNDRVVISENVTLLTHDYSVTTVMLSQGIKSETDVAFVADIVLGRNTFIGLGSVVLPGTRIEENVIVGAGSVCSGILTANSVYAGCPARRICSIKELHEKWNRSGKYSALRVD